MSTSSDLPGFYRLGVSERWDRVAERTGVTAMELRSLTDGAGLTVAQADRMSENVIGFHGLPLGLCVNLRVDDADRIVPMAIEEPSVVAAASHAGKLLRGGRGVETVVSRALMVGQIQLMDVPDAAAAVRAVSGAQDELLREANALDPRLVAVGGGAIDVTARRLPPAEADDPLGTMLIVELVVDVQDAMGANAVNTLCEGVTPTLERLTGGRARLRILSNLADRRTVVATGRVPLTPLGRGDAAAGEALAWGIVEASVFAERDPYRAATHNKGIMNGVDAVLLALGQDWRAVEAGAHAFAARGTRYTALSRWRVRGAWLEGRLELPMAVGVVGGVVRVHPTVRTALRLAGVETAADLAALSAAVGLAQNLGALRALAGEGIQRGHMKLHARNVAVQAGAEGDAVDRVAAAIVAAGAVTLDAAARAVAQDEGGEAP